MSNIALWIVQALLAGVFTLTGTVKLVVPREKLEKRMHWAATWPRLRIRRLGEGVLPAIIVGALCLVVATGRLAPLARASSPIQQLSLEETR